MGAHPSGKPIYKNHRSVAAYLISRPFYPHGGRYNKGLRWKPLEEFKLDILAEADSDIEAAADVLGRPDSCVAYHALKLGITLPRQWMRLVIARRTPKPKTAKHPAAADFVYPYIRTNSAENADIRAINALVPSTIIDHMRSDICQEIMVAILEGRTTLENLRAKKANSAYFIRKFYKDNFECSGHALSFEATSENDEFSYDEIASSIAAKEWHHEKVCERQKYIQSFESFRPYTPPTQFQAAWNDQVGRYRLSRDELGQFLTQEEAEELLEGV